MGSLKSAVKCISTARSILFVGKCQLATVMTVSYKSAMINHSGPHLGAEAATSQLKASRRVWWYPRRALCAPPARKF